MKYFFCIVLFMSSVVVNAQSKKERKVLSNDRLLEETVFGTKDSLVLEKLFGKTLHYQHSGGKVETRAQALHNIVHNKSTYVHDLSRPAPYNVSTAGDSIVVTHDYVAVEKKDNGTDVNLDLSIRTTWMKEKGQWRLFRRVATKNKH